MLMGKTQSLGKFPIPKDDQDMDGDTRRDDPFIGRK